MTRRPQSAQRLVRCAVKKYMRAPVRRGGASPALHPASRRTRAPQPPKLILKDQGSTVVLTYGPSPHHSRGGADLTCTCAVRRTRRSVTFVTAGALFAVDLTGYGRPMHLTTTGTTVTISRGDTHVIAQAIDGGSDADLKAAFTALGVQLGQTTGFPVDGVSADRWYYDEDDTHRVWWLDLSDRGERPW